MPRSIGNDGLETVYDNRCDAGYYLGLNTRTQNGAGSTGPLAAGDWGGVPGTAFAGNTSCTPGCADSYEVRQFTFAYCTSDGVVIDLVLHFWDRTATGGAGLDSCDGVALIGETVPPVFPRATWPASPTGMADITLTGLPRSSSASPSGGACYAVTVVLDTPGFTLTGGTVFPLLSSMGDRFSWSMQVTSGKGDAGPLLAGNALFGSPCTFCAGTLWEAGGQTTNTGLGLGEDDHAWLDSYGGSTPPTGNCFTVGGNPFMAFFMALDAFKPCGGPSDFCSATDGALASCPCGNAGDPDTGCDNAQGTGGVHVDVAAQTTSPNGATLTGTGFPTMASPTAIVLRSNALDPASPVVFGDGLRCVAASPLVRLAAATASGGSSTHAFGHGALAGVGDFFYQLWYRNTPSSFCDPLAAFNLSSGVSLTW
jgi:hypothetical protein